ncbi:excinuclease ABC subunit UvrC [Pseudoflavonifractor phocaeensis]|uniref:excinuclease ABC subunit UvrC n=1 Tax=Pseudoflavonifractor phocaeensis TaxID=1870988 RepID=UPI001F1A5782|nr:excinuclease ABC subunit UvrC [Pseudoflavonifractor phocaeensis]MCF2661328.1 excinuclease ABC subunit UvrC [Pseudoflavonifractor phocaeensis]
MTFDELKEKAHSLPLKPGVYIMQDAKNTVIYVGKAKALKNRVSQYFQDSSSHTEKTRAMVSQIDHFDVIIADSEFEALVLECSLIKRHQPRYNILLKDDKGYPYIRLSNEAYPRFSLASKAAEDGARYFGPYASRHNTQAIIDALRTALRLPSCHKKFPRDIGKERPCLNFHMGKCDGYCRSDEWKEQHDRAMAQAVSLLEGHFKEVQADLTAEMERAAEELRFEQAAELRDRLRAIELLGKRQKVIAGSLADTDVTGFFRGTAKSCFVVLHYVEGELAAKDFDLFESPVEEDEGSVLSSLMREYYVGRTRLPKQILLPCELTDQVSLTRMLSEQVGSRVELVTPQRGAKMDLIRLANQNAREEVERATTREERQNKLLEALGRMLGLDGPPRRMESYDISNQGASDIVASMVVYVDGKPLKRDYRRFKLKDMDGPDDYASMEQVLTRRFRRYLDGDEKFSDKPDLLLIDGGHEHVKVAARVLAAMNLDIPAYGMVKDDRHRTRALVHPDGREIGIQAIPAVFALIGQIQEETHRFAIEYHRQLQAGHVKTSVLDKIPGVGEVRRTQLLKHFKSVKTIKAASLEQLQEVVPKNAAQAVYQYFHGEE